MRNLSARLFIALITFALGIAVASFWLFFRASRKPQSPASPSVQSQSPKRSEEILRVLMPNDVWGDVSKLERFDHSEEVQVLREAQVKAEGDRAIGIAFLLAALGEDYESNRGRLLERLKECAHKSYPEEGECTDIVADHLMELCRRGDYSLFKPLFDVSNKADGAFSESLWAFYSDMLYKQPEQFLKALASYPKKKQSGFCWEAGIEDGSGMDEERFRHVSQSLNDISARSDNSLRPIARTCLLGVETGYKRAMEDNKSIEVK